MKQNRPFGSGLFVFLFFVLPFAINAQTPGRKISLKAYLSQLEKEYHLIFSYSEKDVSTLQVAAADDTLSLQNKLNAIFSQTYLSYKMLENGQVILFKINNNKTESFCGYLRDNTTQEVIQDAIILDGSKAYFSNDSGYFEIGLVQNSMLLIKRIGYEPQRINLAGIDVAQCPTISLTPELTPLEAVEVTNYFATGLDKRVNGAFTIDTRSLDILPGMTEADVLFTLQSLPGIYSRRETVSNISIRGGTFDQNLIQYDGMRMFQSGHFFGLISGYNPYFLDEVTLIKNGSSPSLGHAVSGTIQIQSTEAVEEDFALDAGFNMVSADINASIPITSRMSLSVGARRSLSNAIRTPVYSQYFNRAFRGTEVVNNDQLSVVDSEERFRFEDYNVKWNWNMRPDTKVSVSFITMRNNLEHLESRETADDIETRTSTLTQSSIGGITKIEHRVNDFLIRFSSSVSNYRLRGQNYDLDADQLLLQENEVLDFTQMLTAHWLLSDRLDIMGGYTLDNMSIDNLEELNRPAFRRFVREVQTSHTAFSQLNYNSQNQKFQTSLGLRYQYYQDLHSGLLEPRVVMNLQLSENLSLTTAAEQKNQASVQIIDLQNDFLGVEKRRWILSNQDDVPVLKSKQASAGLTYQKKDLVLSTEVYIKQVQGILSSSQGFQNQFEFIRTDGSYASKGLEIFMKKDLERLSFWSSYTLSETRYDFPGLSVRDFPSNLDIRHVATAGARMEIGDFSFSSSINWNSGLAYTPIAANPVSNAGLNYEPPNSDNLRDFLRIDLSGSYAFTIGNDSRVELHASIWNLLDRENIIGTYYRTNEDEQVRGIEESALGFTPNLSVRIKI